MKYETLEKAYYKDKTTGRNVYEQLYASRSSNKDSTIQIWICNNCGKQF